MNLIEQYELKIGLLNLVSDRIQEFYRDLDDLEQSHLLIELIELYVIDLKRKLTSQSGRVEYLFSHLKRAVRLAGELMQKTQEAEAQSLAGWYYGCTPENIVQAFYNLFSEAALESTRSILEIEAEWPELQPYFDWEREHYRQKCLLGAEQL